MNYQKIYDEIINNAKSRGLNKKLLNYYTEKHHIVPKCLGGTNDKSNLVLLTGREHYLCHYLLWKSNKENKSLFYAYRQMAYSKNKFQNRNFKLSSKQYNELKLYSALNMSKIKKNSIPWNKNGNMSNESKLKMSFAKMNYTPWNKNKHHTSISKERIKEKRLLQTSIFSIECKVYDKVFKSYNDAYNYCKIELNMSNKNIEDNFNDKNNLNFIKSTNKDNGKRTLIQIEDKIFKTKNAAAEYCKSNFGFSHNALINKLKSNDYPNWRFL